jgi:hypothetical protein
LLFQLPRDSRVFTALNPSAQWGWDQIFANKTNYLLELLVWQNATPSSKGKLAAHKRRQPKLFIPDFMKPQREPKKKNKDTATMTVDDVKSWLSAPRGV